MNKINYRLGSGTGSLVNYMMGNGGGIKPEVGMGATALSWSDRHPHTIIEVSENGKRILTQADHYERTDSNGMSESQDYKFTPNPNAAKESWTLRKDGSWVREGDPLKNGQRIRIGERDCYYDFSF